MEFQLRMFLSKPKSSPFSNGATFPGPDSFIAAAGVFENRLTAFALPRISFEKLSFLTTLLPRRRSFDGWFSNVDAGIASRQHPAP